MTKSVVTRRLERHSRQFAEALLAASPDEIERALEPLLRVTDSNAYEATVTTLVTDVMITVERMARHRAKAHN